MCVPLELLAQNVLNYFDKMTTHLAVNIGFQSEQTSNEDGGSVDDTGRHAVCRVRVDSLQDRESKPSQLEREREGERMVKQTFLTCVYVTLCFLSLLSVISGSSLKTVLKTVSSCRVCVCVCVCVSVKCIRSLGSAGQEKGLARVSGQSSPVVKDFFNPPPLVLKASGPTMPKPCSYA